MFQAIARLGDRTPNAGMAMQVHRLAVRVGFVAAVCRPDLDGCSSRETHTFRGHRCEARCVPPRRGPMHSVMQARWGLLEGHPCKL